MTIAAIILFIVNDTDLCLYYKGTLNTDCMCLFQIITHVDPLTECVKYYTPRGRFVHVPPTCPRTDWANDFGKPWWKDMRYEVGTLTAKARWIRIINTLTAQEQRLEVDIQLRSV